jgi:hypothetical protein
LIITELEETSPEPIHLLLNWKPPQNRNAGGPTSTAAKSRIVGKQDTGDALQMTSEWPVRTKPLARRTFACIEARV